MDKISFEYCEENFGTLEKDLEENLTRKLERA